MVLKDFSKWNWDAAFSTTVELDCPKEGTLIWASDIHAPFQNKRAVDLLLKVIQDEKPEFLFWGGDDYDFYAASDFDREPDRYHVNLKYEFDQGRYIFEEGQKWAEKVLKFIGNHEWRFGRQIIRKVPAFYGLPSLNLKELAGLPKDIEVVPHLCKVKLGKLHFHHGEIASKSGNGTAMAMSKKYPGINLIQGHDHKEDIQIQTFGDKQYEYHVSGTLCDFKKARYVNNPNWTTGFILVDFWTTASGHKQFKVHHCRIVNNEVMVRGKLYK